MRQWIPPIRENPLCRNCPDFPRGYACGADLAAALAMVVPIGSEGSFEPMITAAIVGTDFAMPTTLVATELIVVEGTKSDAAASARATLKLALLVGTAGVICEFLIYWIWLNFRDFKAIPPA
jgi:hypothetical protein